MASKLILMRHGRSLWNDLNLFTGWVDIPLDEKGVEESFDGGEKIKDIPIDVVFTSTLIRAQMTAVLALLRHSSQKVPLFLHPKESQLSKWGEIHSKEALQSIWPVHIAAELNERMYGKLQGMNKLEMAKQFGQEQVQKWRRSFDAHPPEGESLKDTCERALPYFKKEIVPYLEKNKNVFIAAHGNSLRAIVMYLDGLSPEEVAQLEIATGKPLVYSYEQGKWRK